MTALEVEMARAARWIEAHDSRCGVELYRGPSGCFAAISHSTVGSYSETWSDRPEDALCELLDKVEGRG